MYSDNRIGMKDITTGPCKRDYEDEMAQCIKHLQVVNDAAVSLEKLADYEGLPGCDKERDFFVQLYGSLAFKRHQLQDAIDHLTERIESKTE